MKYSRAFGAGLTMLIMIGLVLIPAASSTLAAGPARVVVLPFSANAKEDISFVVKGLRDMLASRLPWKDKVIVMEPDLVAPVLKKIKPPYNDAKARQVGKELSAQIVVFGSITQLGKSISVDARVVKVDQSGPALTAFIQAKDLDQVIPQINAFAQRINAEIFRRPDAIAAQKAAQEPKTKPMVAGGSAQMDNLPANISPLNPLFLKRLSGVESDRYWRSPRLMGQITDLAVGDIDNDGRNELVCLFTNKVRFYRLTGKSFSMIYELKNGPRGTYLFVDVADIDGDGRNEIFISNRLSETVNSFVLEWRQGRPAYKVKGTPYYYRVQPDPLGGKKSWLFGQKTAVDSPFWGPVYKMRWNKGDYEPERELDLPEMASIYNFVLGDFNGSGKIMTALMGPTYHLRVFNRKNQQIWMSGELYNMSNKFIVYMALEGTDYEESWWYIFSRLLLADLNKDGRQEIICQRSKGRFGMALEKTRMLYQSTLFSLSWNGLSLVEDWRTPRISGSLLGYTLGDAGNVGRPALIMSVGQKVFSGFLDKGASNLVAFTLKVPKKRTSPLNKGL
jgi:TolB-like protein